MKRRVSFGEEDSDSCGSVLCATQTKRKPRSRRAACSVATLQDDFTCSLPRSVAKNSLGQWRITTSARARTFGFHWKFITSNPDSEMVCANRVTKLFEDQIGPIATRTDEQVFIREFGAPGG